MDSSRCWPQKVAWMSPMCLKVACEVQPGNWQILCRLFTIPSILCAAQYAAVCPAVASTHCQAATQISTGLCNIQTLNKMVWAFSVSLQIGPASWAQMGESSSKREYANWGPVWCPEPLQITADLLSQQDGE